MRCADSPLALLLETVDGSHSPGGLRLPSFPSRSAGGYSADIQHKEGNTENLKQLTKVNISFNVTPFLLPYDENFRVFSTELRDALCADCDVLRACRMQRADRESRDTNRCSEKAPRSSPAP